MSTEQELKELMGLVGALAQDTALYMGNVVQINKVQTSAQALEDRLRALLAELDAAREDAARYEYLKKNHVRYWKSTIGGLDSVDFDFEANGSDVDAAIDAARKVEA